MSLPQPSESFAWTQEPWGPALRCTPLLAVAPHLFTSAAVSVSRETGDSALAGVAASLGVAADAVVQVHQVHGRAVKVIGTNFSFCHSLTADGPMARTEIRPDHVSADALVSDDPQRAVGVRVADCAPILFADRAGRAVAAVHAGWRGTAAGVVGAAVSALRESFGVAPRDLLVAFGPSIRRCCYEVGPELREQFAASGHARARIDRWFSKGKGDRWQLDVPLANREQLEAAGLASDRIFDSGLCTACHDGVFHSYRKSGAAAGRMLGVIRVNDHRPKTRDER